jgi:hypothetical protein
VACLLFSGNLLSVLVTILFIAVTVLFISVTTLSIAVTREGIAMRYLVISKVFKAKKMGFMAIYGVNGVVLM